MPDEVNDYEDIANRSWDDIPEPHTLPIGTWRLKAANASYAKAKSGDQNDRIMFFYRAVEPLGDVAEEALDDLGDNFDVTGEKILFQVWMEGSRDWDTVRRHLRMHEIDPSGRKVAETLKAFGGQEVFAYLGERSYTTKGGENRTENTMTNFQPADD